MSSEFLPSPECSESHPQILVENLIALEDGKRETMHGLAIDNPDTKHPEDAIFVESKMDGSFEFSISVVEASLLDRNGESLKYFLHEIRTDPENAHLRPPRDRRRLNYSHDYQIPSLTIVGSFNPSNEAGSEFGDFDIVRSTTNPTRYTIADTAKHSDRDYLELSDFIHAIGNHFSSKSTGKSYTVTSGRVVVDRCMTLFNLGLSSLAADAKLPQLYRVFPYRAEVNQQPIEIRGYSASPDTVHAQDANEIPVPLLSGASGVLRSDYQWINMVMITHFMDTGESILSEEEMEEIAQHMTEKRVETRAASQRERAAKRLASHLQTSRSDTSDQSHGGISA